MKDAVLILEHVRARQMPCDAAEDGFVFSTAQLDAALRRRDRLEEASQAQATEVNRLFFIQAAGSE